MVPEFRTVASVHHGTLIGRRDRLPVTVETAAARWAYAVAFALRPDGGTSSLCSVRVTAVVERGRVGIGCLDRAESTFVDEAFVDAGATPTTVELLAEAPASMGPLIVRNAALDGASRATIVDIACVPLGDVDAWSETLTRPRALADWAQAYGSAGRGLAERARLRRFTQLEAPATMRWPDGLRFELVPGDQVSRVVYLSGTYEPNTLRVIRTGLRPGSVLIDAGANAGLVSMAAASWVGASGRVIALEPSAREFARLTRHVALNGLSQVTAIRAAVTAVPGPQTLHVASAATAGGNTLGARFAYPGIVAAGDEIVDGVTLNQLADALHLPTVDVVKLDVEGSEVHALQGAAGLLRRHRPTLVVEVCATALEGHGTSVAMLGTVLRDAGYRAFEIDDGSGALRAVAELPADGDRNVVAFPIEHAEGRLQAAGTVAAS
jgi:FkbM family methyltransferase